MSKRGPKKAKPIDVDGICSYGCGNKAKFINESGNLMCEPSANRCPKNRKKNSDGIKTAYSEGRMIGWNIPYEKRASRLDKRFAEFGNPGKGQFKNALLLERGHRCECCGMTDWMNKPITLELEHTDGDRKNNTRENLKLLCPNCHSQTPTWRRSGDKRTFNKQKFTDQEIIDAIKTSKNINQVLTKLDLRYGSVSTIVKIMIAHKVEFMGN